MPNWCSNQMAIVGKSADLLAIKKLIDDVMTMDSQTLYNTALAAGYTAEQADELDCRGSYDCAPEIYETKDGVKYLEVCYESAWTPCIDFWNGLLAKFFPECSQYTVAEECGCEVYVNTDSSRHIFPWDYAVDYSNPHGDGGIEYFESKEQALEFISKTFDREVADESALGKLNEELEEEDGFASLHELGEWY